MQGPDGEMVGTCHATIVPSPREGYEGAVSNIVVSIDPPWDQKIASVTLLVLPSGRELAPPIKVAAGKFRKEARFSGQSGPINLLFAARDAEGNVHCQGSVGLVSKGPKR